MKKGLDQLVELKDDSLSYLKLRLMSMKLRAVDRISDLLSKAFGYLLFVALLFVALTFLMVALALWLGEVLGSDWLGFLTSGGAFLLASVLIYFIGHRFVSGAVVRFFMDLFFTEKNDDYEIQE